MTPEGVRPGPSTPDLAPRRAARGGGSYGYVLPNRYCFLGGDHRAERRDRKHKVAIAQLGTAQREHVAIQAGEISCSRPELALNELLRDQPETQIG